MPRKTIRLKLVPNEDGFGPSMALYYVARGLYAEANRRDLDLRFTIQNQNQSRFNLAVYSEWIHHGGSAQIQAKDSVIQLSKDGARVRARETAESLLDYPTRSTDYCHDETDINNFDGVMSMGAPIICRAASGVNPFNRKIPSIEVFDHAWSVSLRRIIFDDIQKHPEDWRERRVGDVQNAAGKFDKGIWPSGWRTRLVSDVVPEILSTIESDEATASAVFLFPDFLCASEFYCHWQRITVGRAQRLTGVFGGWSESERKSKRNEVRHQIAERLHIAVDDQTKIALVQGGGTPIWNNFLVRMILECVSLQAHLKNMLFLFAERQVFGAIDAAKKGATQKTTKLLDGLLDQINSSSTVRLVTTGDQKGFRDFQELYVASDLVFSRPGGITVQDAVACRTPIVCAVEPGQWQTEKIRVNCELHGLLRTVPFEAFEVAGVGLVLDHIEHPENDHMRAVMATVPNRLEYQEGGLAERILDIVEKGSAED